MRQPSDIIAVDLFAGIGALSLGVTRAGAHVAMAVEVDESTAASYVANNPDVNVLKEEITPNWRLAPKIRDAEIEMHLLMGGPPCRGWSSLGARSDGGRRDKYQACTWDFARLVHETEPPAFLFENVNGLQHAQRGEVVKSLVGRLEDKGKYIVSTALLRAADFGVPQLRQRLFIVGIRRDLDAEYEFPEPTHDPDSWVTVDEAIDDLPGLKDGEMTKAYIRPPRTTYQRTLRGDSSSLTWHEAPTAGATVKKVLAKLAPGQDRSDLDSSTRPSSGFHNTYGRMRGDAPASAVTGSIGRISSGRHAHPHQDRALTPREAARLQSLPDGYRLSGYRWEVYRQVGDAVPPRLAEQVSRPLIDKLARVL